MVIFYKLNKLIVILNNNKNKIVTVKVCLYIRGNHNFFFSKRLIEISYQLYKYKEHINLYTNSFLKFLENKLVMKKKFDSKNFVITPVLISGLLSVFKIKEINSCR